MFFVRIIQSINELVNENETQSKPQKKIVSIIHTHNNKIKVIIGDSFVSSKDSFQVVVEPGYSAAV